MSFEKEIGVSLNLLFPSDIYCAACGNLIDGTRPYALCDVCVREIPWHTGDTCDVCGKALAPHRTGGVCRECRERGRSFDAGLSCCSYTGRARLLVREMKYRDAAWIAAKLADAMYDRWLQLGRAGGGQDCIQSGQPDSVLPSGFGTGPGFVVTHVPMAEAKRRARGYDQAETIARRLARLIGAPFADGMLVRRRDTAVMSALGAHERRANMDGAFEAGEYARGLIAEGDPALRNVVLIDDVFTTGSTADACAAALKESGVKRVTLFTFASGADVDPAGDGSLPESASPVKDRRGKDG
jgi:predicted amidophosphoribosyltransferase